MTIALLGMSLFPTSGLMAQDRSGRDIGLQGYCPVEIIEGQMLRAGHPGLSAKFDGVTYHFSSREARRRFKSNPVQYVPALKGDCVVCYERSRVRVRGSLKHSTIHEGRLYLFPSNNWLQEFKTDPQRYINVDLAAGGQSIVWLINRGVQVNGIPQHTEIHNGFRYQFASDEDRSRFLSRRNLYVAAARRHGPVLVAEMPVSDASALDSYLIPPRPVLN